ncbi:hypothetical protein ACTD5D_15320 [Nocardia takedensis]|uniref:hypothetical protein n=1 Tax=Nocardia takedensis TaxID=259390 RepID=UPI0002F991BE|nr:hypothetical protein [Nocardia takedensis]
MSTVTETSTWADRRAVALPRQSLVHAAAPLRSWSRDPGIGAVRGLTEGGAVAAPLLTTPAWTVGLIAVFGPIAVRGYRRAAEQR